MNAGAFGCISTVPGVEFGERVIERLAVYLPLAAGKMDVALYLAEVILRDHMPPERNETLGGGASATQGGPSPVPRPGSIAVPPCAVSGVRGWQTRETQDSRQNRSGHGTGVRMRGWAKPDRVEISGTDTLTDFIQSDPPGGQDPGAREGQRGSELKLWQRKIFRLVRRRLGSQGLGRKCHGEPDYRGSGATAAANGRGSFPK